MSGHLSNSQLTSFADCGEKYRLSYIEGAPKRAQGPLIGGIAVHRAVEHGLREGLMLEPSSKDEIEAVYLETLDAMVAEAGGPDSVRWVGRKTKAMPAGEDIEFWHGSAPLAMLARAHDLAVEDAENGVVLWGTADNPTAGVELKIDIPFSELRTITARIDALVVDANGQPMVRDYATGKPGGKTELQGALYALALERAEGFNLEVETV